MEKQLAPIVLFVYNRPWHTLQTLEALAKNHLANDSVLYIYADGPKDKTDSKTLEKIEETRKVLKEKQWCKEVQIIESENNIGLADSIINGVTKIIEEYGKIIVLEDDIVTSKVFLEYMNKALNLYEDEEKVMHISGFVPLTKGAEKLPETYFLRFMSCWGWATWKRAWDKRILDISYLYEEIPKQPDYKRFNLDGVLNQFSQIEDNFNHTIKTWGIRWYSTIFLEKGLCLYPRYSIVDNIGLDGSGIHCPPDNGNYHVNLISQVDVKPIKIQENKIAYNYLKYFYKTVYNPKVSLKIKLKEFSKKSILYKIYSKIRYK